MLFGFSLERTVIMTRFSKTTRRPLIAGLAATGLGLALALSPAVSASAATSGSITINNNCGTTISVSIYRAGNWVLGGQQAPGTQTYTSTANTANNYRIVLPKGTVYAYLGDGGGFGTRAC
jgi:hypothetical protein